MKQSHVPFLFASLLIYLFSFPTAIAQIQIPYGSDSMQYGELIIPEGDGPFPIATFLHAGCWRSSERMIGAYQAMAKEMAKHGVASWNLQYRGATSPGGGWPGTWLDIANGFDKLAELAESYPLDTTRAVVIGHSSGGHYGAWLAMRAQLPPDSAIYVKPKLEPMALVMADAYINPLVIDSIGTGGELYCGEPLLEKLVGGPIEENIDNFLQISPLEWLPWGIPQDYIVSTYRYPVSLPREFAEGKTAWRTLPDYPALAVLAGDEVNMRMLSNEDHGAFVREGARGYNATVSAVLRLLGKATE